MASRSSSAVNATCVDVLASLLLCGCRAMFAPRSAPTLARVLQALCKRRCSACRNRARHYHLSVAIDQQMQRVHQQLKADSGIIANFLINYGGHRYDDGDCKTEVLPLAGASSFSVGEKPTPMAMATSPATTAATAPSTSTPAAPSTSTPAIAIATASCSPHLPRTTTSPTALPQKKRRASHLGHGADDEHEHEHKPEHGHEHERGAAILVADTCTADRDGEAKAAPASVRATHGQPLPDPLMSVHVGDATDLLQINEAERMVEKHSFATLWVNAADDISFGCNAQYKLPLSHRVACVRVTLAAVSLTSGASAETISLGEYLDSRAATPWPHGFATVASYEAAWATGALTTHYIKDAEIQPRARKVAGGRTRSKRAATSASNVMVPGIGSRRRAHIFDLTATFYSEASLFRVLPRAVARSFRGVSTPYHYIKAGPAGCFPSHAEQLFFDTVSEFLSGGETWCVVPHHYYSDFVTACNRYVLQLPELAPLFAPQPNGAQVAHCLATMLFLAKRVTLPPTVLEELGVPFALVRRVPGTVLRVHGAAVHSGWPSAGHGHAVASNVCTLTWLESVPLLVATLRDLVPTLAEWSYVNGEEDPRALPCFDALPDGCMLAPSLREFRAAAATAPQRQPLTADAQRRLQTVFTTEVLENALNMCPPLWGMQFCHALRLDMLRFQDEQAAATAPAVSTCRFGRWVQVAPSIERYLAELTQLQEAIAALGPWHLRSNTHDSGILSGLLPQWTTTAIHATICS